MRVGTTKAGGTWRHPAIMLTAAAAVAAIAGVMVSARGVALLGGIVVALVIGLLGPWIAVAGCAAEVGFDRRRCRLGEPLTASIAWRRALPWWRPRPTMTWPDGTAVIPTTDPPGPAGVTAVLVPRRRGRFPRSAPRFSSDAPLGVLTAHRAAGMPECVIVWPERRSIRFPSGLAAGAGSGYELSERVAGMGGDVIGARDYRAGDSARSIHWAHTARRGNVVVRERPGRAAAAVRLLIDHRIEPSADEEAIDGLVTVAFAIVESWWPRGVGFELHWPGRGPCMPRTPAELTRALDALACLEPAGAAAEPWPWHGRCSAVDLEIVLTTPAGRSMAARDGTFGCSGTRSPRRLWIVIDPRPKVATPSSIAATRSPPNALPRDVVIEVAAFPDPVAAVDARLDEFSTDPDHRGRHRAGSLAS
jgi:uncharacterized protein (DUF58 family)